MVVRFNHPSDLKKISNSGRFGNLKIIGTLGDAIKRDAPLYKARGVSDTVSYGNTFSSGSQPQLLAPTSVQNAYRANDWNTIKSLQDKSNKDLTPLYSNFSNHPENSWIEVQNDEDSDTYYMSWDNNGNYAWSWCSSVDAAPFDPFNPDVKFTAPAQFGVFSKSTSICGIHSYNFGTALTITKLAVSGILSLFLSKLIKQGINFLAEKLMAMVGEAATETGLSMVFTIGSYAMTALCSVAVFAIVFIGLAFLWNYLNKKFQICLSVYNWDTTNDWQIITQEISNGVNPGEPSTKTLNIELPKAKLSGDQITAISLPADIRTELKTTTQSIVNYAFIVYENKQTFMEGCSFALNVEQVNNPDVGFTYAFQCPWSDNNAQYMENTPQDPSSFLSKARSHWSESVGPFSVNVQGIPIRAYIDALKGGDVDGTDNYKVAVHINPPSSNL